MYSIDMYCNANKHTHYLVFWSVWWSDEPQQIILRGFHGPGFLSLAQAPITYLSWSITKLKYNLFGLDWAIYYKILNGLKFEIQAQCGLGIVGFRMTQPMNTPKLILLIRGSCACNFWLFSKLNVILSLSLLLMIDEPWLVYVCDGIRLSN